MDEHVFNCLKCNNTYLEQSGDYKSEKLDEYIRFMGYCKGKCWDSMNEDLRFRSLSMAYTKGDIMKRRHRFYHKELPGFSKRNPPTE